jgi:hypothetical protein
VVGGGGLLFDPPPPPGRPGVFWGVALIVLGIAFFRRHAEREARLIEATAVEAPAAPAAPAETTTPLPDLERAAPSPPRARRARRERSGLGLLTIGAVMVALGVASLLDVSGALHIRLVQYLALALSILGLGMLTGTFLGRARWLILPSILLVPFVLTASLINVPFKGGSGDRFIRPPSAAAVHREYHITAGHLVIDLGGIKTATQPIYVRATAVAGEIVFHVPKNVSLTLRGRVGAGEVDLFGTRYDGIRLDVKRSYTFGSAKDAVPLILDLETSLGKVHVTQAQVLEAA